MEKDYHISKPSREVCFTDNSKKTFRRKTEDLREKHAFFQEEVTLKQKNDKFY